ncbi:MAG: hypothetical protein SFZ03_08990 [Candidatus Melainabacteria bacterium]|nr:hypothetical protein [Candidatus Melainabacteria bacterium]
MTHVARNDLAAVNYLLSHFNQVDGLGSRQRFLTAQELTNALQHTNAANLPFDVQTRLRDIRNNSNALMFGNIEANQGPWQTGDPWFGLSRDDLMELRYQIQNQGKTIDQVAEALRQRYAQERNLRQLGYECGPQGFNDYVRNSRAAFLPEPFRFGPGLGAAPSHPMPIGCFPPPPPTVCPPLRNGRGVAAPIILYAPPPPANAFSFGSPAGTTTPNNTSFWQQTRASSAPNWPFNTARTGTPSFGTGSFGTGNPGVLVLQPASIENHRSQGAYSRNLSPSIDAGDQSVNTILMNVQPTQTLNVSL